MTASGDDDPPGGVSRRALLLAGAGGLAAVGVGAAAIAVDVLPVPARVHRMFADKGAAGVIPDVPQQVQLDQRASAARSQTVGFYTAVPDGHGDGRGLPVCLVLHGATATTADYEAFGLGRFLTAAVRAGSPPFVLAGADGGRSFWAGNGASDDPQAMLHDEVPTWCDELGFDTSRMAAYGWSMGGHGALIAAERDPGWLQGVSALSPAVTPGDAVFAGADHLDGSRTAIWCGTADSLYDNVVALAEAIPGGPAIADYSPGAHTRDYWNRVTPDAFAFIGASLQS